MKRHHLIDIISYLFIFLFVYAAVNKLSDVQKFQAQIGQSPLVTAFARPLAVIVPASELLIAIALAIPRLRLIALHASFSLMVLFTAYIVAILNLSVYVPCSCGGILDQLGWTEHLVFNIFFVLLAAVGVLLIAAGQHQPDSISIGNSK